MELGTSTLEGIFAMFISVLKKILMSFGWAILFLGMHPTEISRMQTMFIYKELEQCI